MSNTYGKIRIQTENKEEEEKKTETNSIEINY